VVVRVGNLIDLQVIRGDDRRSWGIPSGRVLRGRVDPHGLWQIGGVWPSLHEALGMRHVGRRKDVLPMVAHGGRLAKVDDGRREKAHPEAERRAVVTCHLEKEARMKTYTCRDVGVDCDWKVRGNDEAEVMQKIRDHARAAHKIDPIPPDLERKVRAAIRDEQ
jgi:predicted small metal-binding protein